MSADEATAAAAAGAGGPDDDGISRCGISGLYDAKGNPAALASGESVVYPFF